MTIKGSIYSYPVRDLAKMTDFYRDVLDFSVEDSGSDGWTTLRCGSVRVAIFPNAHAQPRVTHLMFVVENLEEAIAQLHIGRLDVTDVHMDLLLAKFKDPEGNELAIIELPPGRF